MNLNAASMKQGFDSYNAQRTPEMIDLVTQVRKSLVASGLLNAVIGGFDADPLIIDATTKQPHVQQWILNRYWYRQLTSVVGNTLPIRLNLIENGEPEEWFRLFREKILPFVVQNGLPVVMVPSS